MTGRTPPRHIRSLPAVAALCGLLAVLPGCNTVNGMVYGFERDVDVAVAAVERISDGLLPSSGSSPYRPPLEHFEYRPPEGSGQGRVKAGHSRR